MKKIFFAVMAMAILFSSCGNGSNEKTNAHTHEDGTVHTNHDQSSDKTPDQKVEQIWDLL